jgi:hypothetical protein
MDKARECAGSPKPPDCYRRVDTFPPGSTRLVRTRFVAPKIRLPTTTFLSILGFRHTEVTKAHPQKRSAAASSQPRL